MCSQLTAPDSGQPGVLNMPISDSFNVNFFSFNRIENDTDGRTVSIYNITVIIIRNCIAYLLECIVCVR